MRLTLLCGSLALLFAVSCQHSNNPAVPGDSADKGSDPDRGGAGFVTGGTTLNGSAVTDPNYDDQPYAFGISGRSGDILLVTLRAKLSDNSTPQLAASCAGSAANYSSWQTPANFAWTYEARYVTTTEPINVNVWNSATVNGPLNAAAATWELQYKTTPKLDPGEPNSDNNAATLTDRTQGNAMALGTAITRTLYQFNSGNSDHEDWYKLDLDGDATYKIDLSNYNPRYGTWSYVAKLYDSAGTQLGTSLNLSTAQTSGSLTATIPVTGSYYLQVAGTAVTRNASSNVYYTIYTLKATYLYGFREWGGPGAESSLRIAVDASGNTYETGVINGVVDLDGGPGVTTGGAAGGNSHFLVKHNNRGDFQWAKTWNGAALVTNQIAVNPTGTGLYLAATYHGTVDINPGATVDNRTSVDGNDGILFKMDTSGNFQWARTVGTNGADSVKQVVVGTNGIVYATGTFANAFDFDPGSAAVSKTPVGGIDSFLWRYSEPGTYQGVGTWGTTAADEAPNLALDSTQHPLLWNLATATIDLDPGSGTQSRVPNTKMLYLVVLDSAGAYSADSVFHGTGTLAARCVTRDSSGNLILTGAMTNTMDMDPGAGTQSVASGAIGAAFCLRLSSGRAFQWVSTFVTTSGIPTRANIDQVVTDSSANLYLAGTYYSPTDFDPSAGTVIRNSTLSGDGFMMSLNPSGAYRWVTTTEHSGFGGATASGLALLPGGVLESGVLWTSQIDVHPGVGIDQRSSANANTSDLALWRMPAGGPLD